MGKNKIKQLFKWFTIGAVILSPGVIVMLLMTSTVWWVGLIIMIFSQIFAGYVVMNKLSSSLSEMSINPIKINKMEHALKLASNEEMIKGYIKWVQENSASMNQEEAKNHVENIRQIKESISFIEKYKDR
jgi:hypothetical protein